MILIINICREKLHYYEFVKPIEDILRKNKIGFFTLSYKDIKNKDLEKIDKVIICGTSLKDNDFTKNIKSFYWIKKFEKPIFGICGGMQIIGLIFGGKIRKGQEIGFFKEKFNEDFLGIEKFQEIEVYHLHNFFVECPKDFVICAGKNIPQAIKHKDRPIYSVLFHPEVRQKEVIINFSKL